MAAMLVVAIEYAGSDLSAGEHAPRRGVCEHAYDIQSRSLIAHPGGEVRVAIPETQRGWPSVPQRTRCPTFMVAVTALISDVIAEAIRHGIDSLSSRFELGRP